MNERLKRVLIIIGFVLVTMLLGYLLYRVFFKPLPTPTPTPTPTPGVTGQLPGAGQAGAPPGAAPPPGGLPVAPGVGLPTTPPTAAPARTTVLTETVTSAISMSPSGNGIRSYDPLDGKFYKVLDDGTRIALSNQTFFDVSNVSWGNVTDKAILSFPDGAKILYDFQTNTQATLPKYWEDFNFSPQDTSIVAKSIGNNETNRFLVTANPDGTNAQLIEELGQNQDKVHSSWSPNDQIVAYSMTGDPQGFDRQEVMLIGKHQENFKGLMVEGRGFVPNWSPSGANLLYSVYNSNDDYKPSLWISGAAGDTINANRINLNIQTWANKCAWQSESSIICAVPVQLDAGAGLQPELASSIPDNIFRIDTKTGRAINLGQPDGSPTIKQMTLSPDGRFMYFNDTTTGKLIRFALTQ